MGSQSVYILGNDHQEGHLSIVCDVDFVPEGFLEEFNKYQKKFTHIRLGDKQHKILRSLLIEYKLDNFEDKILSFMGVVNYLYLMNDVPSPDGKLFKDFEHYRLTKSQLLDYLHGYLNNESQVNLKSIKICHESGDDLVITNFFVIDDVLRAYCNSWDLNKDNIEDKKKEILENLNNIKWDKANEHLKFQALSSLYDYFHPKLNSSQASTYRFIGLILHLSAVPTNNNEEIEFFDSLDDNLNSISTQNVRNYIRRPPRVFLS